MTDRWKPSRKHQKQYPHFDKPLSLGELADIANDPQRVAANAFFPFIQFKKSWIPFRADGTQKPKERLIRFACRRDSAIFSRYRAFLSDLYEAQLEARDISDSVLAYRRIPLSPDSRGGKCNIHFAKEAFESIQGLETCCAVVMDISKYFDNIDHERLKLCWAGLLSCPSLPDDHYAVFKALTQYRWVERDQAYLALEFERRKSGFKVPKGLKQLCAPIKFRERIAAAGLIQINENNYGIPQGAPLSDVLANLYLLQFDIEISAWVKRQGGVYRRYSDDILMVLPGGFEEGQAAFQFASRAIKGYGPELEIKKEKTSIVRYFPLAKGQGFECMNDSKGKNGLEYLGFRFDGRRVYLRDSTVSRYYRKMTFYCRLEAIGLVKRFPGKSLEFLQGKVNIEEIDKKYGRVEGFDPKNARKWTFWTYARRAGEIFGDMGRPIVKQVRGYRAFLRSQMAIEINRQFVRRGAHFKPDNLQSKKCFR